MIRYKFDVSIFLGEAGCTTNLRKWSLADSLQSWRQISRDHGRPDGPTRHVCLSVALSVCLPVRVSLREGRSICDRQKRHGRWLGGLVDIDSSFPSSLGHPACRMSGAAPRQLLLLLLPSLLSTLIVARY